MSTITVPRSDVTSGEVAEALRRGIGPVPRITNRLWIARKMRQVLRGTPSLR